MNSNNLVYLPNIVFHPGETLSEKLKELNMDAKELSDRTNLSQKIVCDFLNGLKSITPEMAVTLEKVTGIPSLIWIKKQARFDLDKTT